jgi:hypothetical protein
MTTQEILAKYHKDRSVLDALFEMEMQGEGYTRCWVGTESNGYWAWVSNDDAMSSTDLEEMTVDAIPCPAFNH